MDKKVFQKCRVLVIMAVAVVVGLVSHSLTVARAIIHEPEVVVPGRVIGQGLTLRCRRQNQRIRLTWLNPLTIAAYIP